MLIILTLLSLVSRIHYGVTLFRACVPNSQFHMNDRFCVCDVTGRWNDPNCEVSRRQTCKPGQITWEGCSQCICQEDGQMMCTNTLCGDDSTSKSIQTQNTIDVKRMWCIPFVSYYVNCSLCVCPASGNMNEARCASDATCPFRGLTDYLEAVKNNVCIPKVMYLFPCLHCLCSDDGFFVVSKCVETCQKGIMTDVVLRCTPRKFYRKDCNICFCPDKGLVDEKLCTKTVCSHRVQFNSLDSVKDKTRKCQRQTFIGPKCVYCECNNDETVNENACIESDCMPIDNFKYHFDKITCSSGEMVPKCIDCFCLHNGYTDPKYCSKDCSNERKLSLLEIAIKDSFNHHQVVDRTIIKKSEADEVCEPKSIYKENGKYCLCPENGDTNSILCISVIEESHTEKTKMNIRGPTVNVDFNAKCSPNTFVDFDCNTCYCVKTGRIDPRWCTFDDCESKKIVLERQKSERIEATTTNEGCTPGSISKENCNFCICSDDGQVKSRACTKNNCAGFQKNVNHVLSCVPLSYYNVDCNICYCPKSGVKNVATCTKKTCEKTFLRSQVCVPGKLFSEECNICVCPPDGNKSDRVCTNNTCDESDAPWKQIFQLSQSLLTYQKVGDTTRNLELCFPGEEFEVGCKLCLCPDMGLRMYATCVQVLCDEKSTKEPASDMELIGQLKTRRSEEDDSGEGCLSHNVTDSKIKKCTPGSMYIIRCRECICPYMGNINAFCRPMRANSYCEQAFPKINYMSMGRRNVDKANKTVKGLSSNASETYMDVQKPPHTHTTWACDSTGRVMDDCYICDCIDGVIIEEHCFRSENKSCIDIKPTFLKEIKLPEIQTDGRIE